VLGFMMSGEDHRWHPADGAIRNSNQVVLSSPEVPSPVAIRYAWDDNPVCNLSSKDGLPATPFRTDKAD
jgi:sialate O-acetylesterase